MSIKTVLSTVAGLGAIIVVATPIWNHTAYADETRSLADANKLALETVDTKVDNLEKQTIKSIGELNLYIIQQKRRTLKSKERHGVIEPWEEDELLRLVDEEDTIKRSIDGAQ